MVSDAIVVSRVTKTFGSIRAVLGATATFRAGVVSVIEGANGSGKSTLLAIAGGLIPPTSGEVSFGALAASRREFRSVLGWVGHESLCYLDLTGRENVELAARLRGVDPRAAYDAAVERFDLAAFGERAVRTYSKGQRQRVALARALVHAPRALMFDEPTTGLDAAGVKRLERIIVEEASAGVTVVVVTHDRAFADAVGQARFVMTRGKLQ